jgi:hypothetical protein
MSFDRTPPPLLLRSVLSQCNANTTVDSLLDLLNNNTTNSNSASNNVSNNQATKPPAIKREQVSL